MTESQARLAEYLIIGLGILALVMIFQPFSLKLFGYGCAMVVLAGLLNNLLPLCAPGVPFMTLVRMTGVIALVFCIVAGLAIWSAWAYGRFLLGN